MFGRTRGFDTVVPGEERHLVAEIQRNPAVLEAECAATEPHDLAGRQKIVQEARVVAHATAEDVAFQDARRDSRPLQLAGHFENPIRSTRLRPHPLPCREQPTQGVGLDGFDIAAQCCQRSAPQGTEDSDVDPFLPIASRSVCPGCNATLLLQAVQDFGDCGSGKPDRGGSFDLGERAIGAGVAADDVPQRIDHRFEEGFGHTLRRAHAERVTQAGHVFDGRKPVLAPDGHLHRATLRDQRRKGLVESAGLGHTGADLVRAQRPEVAQQIVELVGASGLAVIGEALELAFYHIDDVGIEEIAELGVAEQLGQKGAVECQRRRPLLRDRGVVLVHERGDEVEHERGGKRAR